jgi:hypothetical protein
LFPSLPHSQFSWAETYGYMHELQGKMHIAVGNPAKKEADLPQSLSTLRGSASCKAVYSAPGKGPFSNLGALETRVLLCHRQ